MSADARWKIELEAWHLEEAINGTWASVDAYWREDVARQAGAARQTLHPDRQYRIVQYMRQEPELLGGEHPCPPMNS